MKVVRRTPYGYIYVAITRRHVVGAALVAHKVLVCRDHFLRADDFIAVPVPFRVGRSHDIALLSLSQGAPVQLASYRATRFCLRCTLPPTDRFILHSQFSFPFFQVFIFLDKISGGSSTMGLCRHQQHVLSASLTLSFKAAVSIGLKFRRRSLNFHITLVK